MNLSNFSQTRAVLRLGLASLLLLGAVASSRGEQTNILTAGDASGTTSFNAVGHWLYAAPPGPGTNYFTGAFALRTPTSGTPTFLGDSLTISAGGSLFMKVQNNAVTINNLTNSGTISDSVNASENCTLAGNMTVAGGAFFVTAGAASGDVRVFTNAANMFGTGTMTNTDTSGAGAYPGTVVYKGNDLGFTGPMVINSNTTVQASSQTNLGGNPLTFNAAQLVLDWGTLLPLASMAITNANSGVTLNAGGGTFNVASGRTLGIANPITGPGGLTNSGAGLLILNTYNAQQGVTGTNTYTGATVVKAGTLLVNGTHTVATGATGAYAVSSGATLGGNGLIDLSAVNLGVTLASGAKLSPGAAAGTAGTLAFNLGAGTLDISGAVTPANSGALLFDIGPTNASDAVVLASGTLNIGSGVLNFGSFTFNSLSGVQPGVYTLFQAPTITGTLGSGLTGVFGGYNAALSLSGGSVLLTLTVPAHPIPVFSNLTPSQTNQPGISSPIITLTGNLTAIGPTYPAQGESGTVSATIDGVAATGVFTDAVGDFSITFNTTGIPASITPYTIVYGYAGNGTLGAAANDTSTTLIVQPPIVLDASDALGISSFNTIGNWVLYGTTTPVSAAPGPGNTYSTGAFGLRTPATAGNYTFAGDMLTVATGGGLTLKGGSGTNTITVNNLILSGAINEAINPNTIGVVAGNAKVVGSAAFNTSGAANDFRTITNALVLSGTGVLTNTCASGNNPGLVVYTATNTAFTGPIIINNETIVQAGSQASLGGNPASFNPAQLTLDNGAFQPSASFALNNSNSGITITPNGGTFNVPAGLTLTVDEPITNSPDGSGTLTCTDSGVLVLNANDSGFTGGVSVVSGGKLDLAGTLGCGITSDNTSTVEGTGTAAGTLDISGNLTGGTATTAGTLTASGLILENGAVLGGNLTPATTVGQGVNSFIQINGSVTLNNNNIVINPHGTLTVGSTYTLLSCTGGINGSFAPVATTTNLEYSFSVAQVTSGGSTLVQLTVSAEQNCALSASDLPGSSSWNTAGNWTCGAAPTAGATYSTAGFVLNTPAAAGNQVFAGDRLTIGAGGSVLYEGTGGGDILTANWILNGGEIANAGNGYNPNIAGTLYLAGNGAINPGAAGTITLAATLTGTNVLTNGVGSAGTVVCAADDATAFTGPVVISGGTLVQYDSQTNLGANPAIFNAAQLELDNGIFQAEASFALSNADSGITITANGGTFDVPGGMILTIDNPLAGTGTLTNTDGGELVLNGNASAFTGGLQVLNGATLDLNTSLGCGITNYGGGTIEGAGTVAGTVDVSSTLMPGSATNAGTLTVSGLVLENGSTLNVALGSATTMGQGINSFIQVNGNLTLNNNTLNIYPQGPLTLGSTYTVIACTGTVSGSFYPTVNLPSGATFSVATVVTASNTLVQVTFTSEAQFVLTATDVINTSSFNAAGNWSSGAAPAGGAAYSTANFTLRSPASAGNYTFAGDSLTIGSGGGLSIKGGSGDIITVNNLTNSGSINNAINPNTIAVIAGNMTVVGAADFNTSGGTQAGDFRIITNATTMFGDGALTNTCFAGDYAGIVDYIGNNTAFTGPLIVQNLTILQAGSQANLGGNPASFNAAQLTLDNGTFQPTASFALNNANSGITITTNGGTFDVPAGLTLTVANPITGAGRLTSTDSGTLVLNGNNSGLTGGLTENDGATLALNGLLGCGITNDVTSTLEGTGTAVGTLDVSGTLIGGTTAAAGTLTAGGLVLETGATLAANLATATTEGQGVNSFIQVNGTLVVHSNSIVVNPLGTLTAGSTYTVLSCTGGITGSFAPVAHSTSGGLTFNVTSVVSGGSTLVQLTVPAAAKPVFAAISFPAGKLVLSGSNGVASQPFYVLATTNLTTPLAGWQVLSTNAFDANGNFSVTNTVQSGVPQQFFRLQTQ